MVQLRQSLYHGAYKTRSPRRDGMCHLRALFVSTLARLLADVLTLYRCFLSRWLFRPRCLLKARSQRGNPVLQVKSLVRHECKRWNDEYHRAIKCTSILPPGLTSKATYKEQWRLAAAMSCVCAFAFYPLGSVLVLCAEQEAGYFYSPSHRRAGQR